MRGEQSKFSVHDWRRSTSLPHACVSVQSREWAHQNEEPGVLKRSEIMTHAESKVEQKRRIVIAQPVTAAREQEASLLLVG
ncbi:hypothetical protein NJB14197_46880 [Mycobacterium montefiorense]|uniref:Uncharacterized protein n=1 Tax=Mycobacterium montefiorense TaxID=154654 RepID=A0AA37PL40_9MYCO|nr:hypothetical protein MmonteBS_46320 [Mycobacterium montefiorense]GKU35215.1 hypothetical protein NJB14191_25610 [Mycobacterium montefiorense]GKU40169.1 hypothetical protein NJB14192_21560 [Mycobacterium montefiorense]GKU46108.1 hypothetical protein NJB14194_27280 [Mycobacterium montefiorense]GKU52980.1 hypothetical protein NJB14195_42210 [Mycobacterium montefiorense]